MSTWYDQLFASKVELQIPAFRQVVIYGAGHTGQTVAAALIANNIAVEAFLDRRATPGQKVKEIPLCHPEDAPSLHHLPVIVAVFNPHRQARFADIADALKRAGFLHVYSIEQYYFAFPSYFPSLYWLTNPAFYAGNRQVIEAADAVWCDDQSRQLYRALLSHRIAGTDTLPTPTPEAEYMPEDVPMLPPPYRFVDIGAFDGDSLAAIRKKKGLFESIYAFEPDVTNFKALTQRLRTEGPFSTGVTCLFPCGAGDTCTTTAFSPAGDFSAKVCYPNTPQTVQVPIIRIADVLWNAKPNFIKIDVEGFEEATLKGLKELLERDRPMLALCLYHKPTDLFQLPLLLSAWNYPADYYLRLHGEHAFDVILYAIPK